MQRVVVNIGDKIEMTHVKSSSRRKLSSNTYGSMLLDYDGKRSAKISMPIYEGKVIPLEVGDEYDLCFFTSAGLYRCRAKVERRFREGTMYVLNMEFLSLPKKYQRRQFFRLDCMNEIRYRLISEKERTLQDFIKENEFEDPMILEAYMRKLEELQRDWKKATMTDISGGGLRFQSSEKLEKETYLEVEVPLLIGDEKTLFKNTAKVVANLELGDAGEYAARCEFEHLGSEQRELIVKYVFEEQKRRLRKE